MYTIKDVARESGTSIATVSRVINGKTVKEKNYIKITEAMNKLNFSVNLYARSLKTQKTMIVGIVIPDLADVYFMKVAKVIQENFYKRGYSVFLVDSNRNHQREMEQVKLLASKKVDGLIVTPVTNKGDYLKSYIDELPIVLLDQLVEDFETDAVVPDNITCIYEAVKYMIKNGHKRIGFIGGQPDLFTAKERLLGYQKAHQDMGVPIFEDLIGRRAYNEESGYEIMKTFWNKNPDQRPTAVIATNYDLTKGAIIAVRENNINIPKDLSFVGYDFEDLAILYTPQLSIIMEPMQSIGEKVVDVLCRKMNQEIDLHSKGIYRVEPTLMKYGSVKKCNALN